MAQSQPKLTAKQVAALATEQSFQKGQKYFRNGAIVNPVRQGNNLWADCHGMDVYHPRATLGQQGVEASSCTCPYGGGGICKHQVALLLTYVYEPKQFQVLQSLKQLLAKRSRNDLLQMIEQMVQRHPDLMSVVDAPQAPTVGRLPDLAKYQRQVERVFQDDGMRSMAAGLESLAAHGQHLVDSEDWLNAGEVYQLLLEAANTHYDYTVLEIDYNGEVGRVIQTIAEGLNTCLEQAEHLDAERRRRWVETLYNAVLKDIALGGMDYAYPASHAIVDLTTDEDWAWLEPQICKDIEKAGRDSFSNWGQRQLVSLMAAGASKGKVSQTEDEVILELGTPEQQAFFHLEKGSLKEATTIAEANFKALPGLVTQFADALLRVEAPDLALKFVQDCAQGGRSSYQDWLAKFYQQYGKTEQFIEVQADLLKTRFTLQGYQQLQAEAESLGKWKSLRRSLHEALAEKGRYGSLIEIALWEQDWKAAQRYLKKMHPWEKETWQERVADKIKTDEPEAAIAFYQDLIERSIDRRGRDNYRRAARYLKTIQPLYKQIKRDKAFLQYVQGVRSKNSNLPALKQELEKVGF